MEYKIMMPSKPKIVSEEENKGVYEIEGCYAGNRPPSPARLPKGCDAAKLKTVQVR